MDEQAAELGRRLNYRFRHPQLLTDALIHSSADAKRSGASAFERLEFLGDRVLGMVVAEALYRKFPGEAEGELGRRLAALVRKEALATVAQSLGIESALSLGDAGKATPAMLADACEAILGAIYLDGGFEAAKPVVLGLWEPLLAEAAEPPRDAKTALQEWAQGRGLPLPVYAVIGREGKAHDPMFRVSVAVKGEKAVEGEGTSKRAAEQAAAAALLLRLAR